jgi:hypothetical protein
MGRPCALQQAHTYSAAAQIHARKQQRHLQAEDQNHCTWGKHNSHLQAERSHCKQQRHPKSQQSVMPWGNPTQQKKTDWNRLPQNEDTSTSHVLTGVLQIQQEKTDWNRLQHNGDIPHALINVLMHPDKHTGLVLRYK